MILPKVLNTEMSPSIEMLFTYFKTKKNQRMERLKIIEDKFNPLI